MEARPLVPIALKFGFQVVVTAGPGGARLNRRPLSKFGKPLALTGSNLSYRESGLS
jgi:hypothetical protein